MSCASVVLDFGGAPGERVLVDDASADVAAAQAVWQALRFTDAAECERGLRQAGLWSA